MFTFASTISAICTAVICSISARTKDLALVLIQFGQQTVENPQGLDSFQRRRGTVFVIGRQGVDLGWIFCGPISGFALVGAPVVPHHMHQDLEHPGLELRPALELGQTAVHDEEHLLHHIVHVRWPDSHATHRPPDKIHLRLVHGIEVGDRHATLRSRGLQRVPGRGSHADPLVPGRAQIRHQKCNSTPRLMRTPTAGAWKTRPGSFLNTNSVRRKGANTSTCRGRLK